MRISLSVTNYSWPTGPPGLRSELLRLVRAAEDAGLDTVWVADHLIQADPSSTPDAEMLEAYTTLGYLAAPEPRAKRTLTTARHMLSGRSVPLQANCEAIATLEDACHRAVWWWQQLQHREASLFHAVITACNRVVYLTIHPPGG